MDKNQEELEDINLQSNDDGFIYDHSPEAYAYAQHNFENDDEEFEYNEGYKDLFNEENEQTSGFRKFFKSKKGNTMSLADIHNIEVPTVLGKRILKEYLMAFFSAVFVLAIMIVEGSPSYCVGFIIPALFAYNAISTKLNFASGKIIELGVQCNNLAYNKAQRKSSVTFRTAGTDEELPSYYTFDLSGNQVTKFIPEAVYIIYFDASRPRQLLAYIQM